MKLYIYPKCSTCKKAVKWMDDHGIKYETIDLINETPSAEQLKEWKDMEDFSMRRLFNTSGMKYRELGLKDKLDHMSDQEAFDLLSSDGMLIKRPVLTNGKHVTFGFKEAEFERIIND